jgi:hypothetical protein
MKIDDQNLLEWLNREINTGKTKIVLPIYLLENVTEEALAEARRLAKLAGCKLFVHE